MSAERKKITIKVPSKDQKKKKDLEPNPPEFAKIDDNTGAPDEEPEEDKLLREKLEATAKKLIHSKSVDLKKFNKAFNTLSNEIQSATGSMTSVPKPLKYLRPFYADLRAFYLRNLTLDENLVRKMSDVMSVLAMIMAEEGSREMLRFKLSGNREELGVWGHEFVRALCGEISQEYNSTEDESVRLDLQALSENIVPFLINQNTETEAVDLLFEINKLEYLVETDFIDKSNYERTCLYLTKFAEYVGDLNSLQKILTTTFELYLRCEDLPNALRIALFLNDKDKIELILQTKYGETKEDYNNMMRQLGFILGAHKTNVENDNLDPAVTACIGNEKLHEHFEILAQNLNMQEAKSPEDVYKTHLYGDDTGNAQSAAYNLAATYVNAFVNCGYNKDALMMKETAGEGGADIADWVSKNKDKGKVAAIASLGMISLWNPENGSSVVEEWFDESQNNVNCYAGALLALGITATGTNHFAESAFALIQAPLSDEDDERNSQVVTKICACLGIGFTYAGNPNQEATEFLIGYVGDDELDPSVRFMAGFALGLIHVGSGASEVAGDLTSCLYEFVDDEAAKQLDKPAAKFLLLGWALIYLGKQNLEDAEQRDAMENQLQAIQAIPNPVFSNFGTVLFDCCAYAGSGNVIEVQKLLRLCAETLDESGLTQEEKEEENEENATEENAEAEATADQAAAPIPEPDKEKIAKSSLRQSIAVLGVALITFADPVGRQMADRTFQHLLQYGELAVRRAVPLAMAFIRVSDPEYGQIDILSKLTHDSDVATAMSAIFALGLMAAGTTNSRVAQLLRQLAEFYKNDANVLQVVRISQGLLFAGKGLVTMHPFHSERTLMSPTAVSALLTVMVAAFDMKATLLGEYHMLLYTLALAIRPRMCLTVIDNGNGELEHVKVKVRVGQAVETVGLAGNPKKITGFQTQETPVLINVGDRVELATEEYESYSSVMEGVVVLKKIEKNDS